ncbi:DUF3891 family protein [Bacillus sp. REN3]|uniref:DUF3891 family protein n=1 Tax=Bacillus sp. REN3 TaxID=2802440 RepID=UPI001AEDCC32|nr:DUF3891 family protein [Bacillus sp. REN3]
MIILEPEEEFVLVTQNDHAKISGEAAECWKDEFFTDWTGKRKLSLRCGSMTAAGRFPGYPP